MKFEKDIKYAVLSLFVFITEVAFGKYIAFSGAVPMLTFSFLIVTAILESDISYVMTLSVLLGAISDILYGHGFGTYTAAFFISCYCTFKLKNAIFYSKWLFLTIDSFLLTMVLKSSIFSNCICSRFKIAQSISAGTARSIKNRFLFVFRFSFI